MMPPRAPSTIDIGTKRQDGDEREDLMRSYGRQNKPHDRSGASDGL